MSEKIQKEIEHERDLKNNLLALFIVASTGAVGLMFNLKSILHWFFFIGGVLLSYNIFVSYLDKISKIRILLDSIKEEK